MKNLFKYCAVALAVTTLASCDDFIEDNRYPLDEQTNSPQYWNNAANVENQCNAFYNNYTGYGNGTGTGWFYFKTLSDDQAGGTFATWANTAVPASSSNWSSPFTEIRRANYIITNMQTSTLSETERKHYEGVARLNRAWQYYQLVRMYGDVPWIPVVADPGKPETIYGARDDRDFVMDEVLKDLNFACLNINGGSKITWSKDLANAMKAEICLFEGTYCKYRTVAENGKAPNATRAAAFLEECVDACEAVMPKYSLGEDYQATYNSTDLSGNKEIIFYKPYQNNIFYHSLVSYTCSSTQINGMTKDAFDAYLFKDGKPKALTTLDASDVATIEYPGVDEEGKPKKAEAYEIQNLLDVRDGRLAKTIDPVIYFEGMGWTRAGAMDMTSSTGYGVCKYDNITLPNDNRVNNNKAYTQAPLFWLAVIYCNFAEAKAELGTITDADLDASINKLYARAGLPALKAAVGFSDPANTWGVSDIIWEVRRCRRCELMFDNWYRYWDLVRWHQLDKLDTQKNSEVILGANISQYFDYVEKYNADAKAYNEKVEEAKRISLISVPANNGTYMNASKGKTRVYEARQYLYPIPSGQITLNENLEQNELWK